MKGPPARIVVLTLLAWISGILLFLKGGSEPRLHTLRLLSIPDLFLAALLTVALFRSNRP